MTSKKSFGYNFNLDPADQRGAGAPLNPNRSSVSIGKREMACSFSPDAQAIYAAPTSPPLTCLAPLDNPKETNPYVIFIDNEINQKDIRLSVHLLY